MCHSSGSIVAGALSKVSRSLSRASSRFCAGSCSYLELHQVSSCYFNKENLAVSHQLHRNPLESFVYLTELNVLDLLRDRRLRCFGWGRIFWKELAFMCEVATGFQFDEVVKIIDKFYSGWYSGRSSPFSSLNWTQWNFQVAGAVDLGQLGFNHFHSLSLLPAEPRQSWEFGHPSWFDCWSEDDTTLVHELAANLNLQLSSSSWLMASAYLTSIMKAPFKKCNGHSNSMNWPYPSLQW